MYAHALITAATHWPEIGREGAPCPVNFTDEELLQHHTEMEIIEGISGIIRQLQDEGLIPLDGSVEREYYEIAIERNTYFKNEFVKLAENQDQRELHASVWPYQ